MSTSAALERLLADLSETHDLEFMRVDTVAAFGRLRDDLHVAWKADVTTTCDEIGMVEGLEKCWAALLAAAYEPVKDFDGLLAKVDLKTEPSCLGVDLLGIVGSVRDEPRHTQAIATLMDPSRCGDLGVALLRAFLKEAVGLSEDWSDDALRDARVTPEAQQTVGAVTVRPDIVVRLADKALLLVVENKVDTRDREKQLDNYALWAKGDSPQATRCLVYLTPEGLRPSNVKRGGPWVAVSYRTLAIAWRRVLAQSPSGEPWVEVLRLYLATITRHIWSFDLSRTLGVSEKLPLLDYVRAASGG